MIFICQSCVCVSKQLFPTDRQVALLGTDGCKVEMFNLTKLQQLFKAMKHRYHKSSNSLSLSSNKQMLPKKDPWLVGWPAVPLLY